MWVLVLTVLALLIVKGVWPAENEFWWKGEIIAKENEGIWNIKREDGNWTNFKEPNEIKFFDGLANGKPALIIRISKNGDTIALRYFYR
jgi:hypothetical protein